MQPTNRHGNYSQGRTCSDCSCPITNICRTGKCRSCHYGPGRTCSECGDGISSRSRTGKCGPCYREGFAPGPQPKEPRRSPGNYRRNRTCSGCDQPITDKNESGKCQPCFNKWRTGTNHHNWKGGSNNGGGYRVIYGHKGHPNAHSRGEILEHILVMTQILGRPLIKGETVHHKNGNRSDNQPKNLELWSSKQPSGQRVSDKIEYAKEILALYGDDPNVYRP